MRLTRKECAICGMEFSCAGRYMSHVAHHGPVIYQCGQCNETFDTRLNFTNHQKEMEHVGQNVIPIGKKNAKNIQVCVRCVSLLFAVWYSKSPLSWSFLLSPIFFWPSNLLVFTIVWPVVSISWLVCARTRVYSTIWPVKYHTSFFF